MYIGRCRDTRRPGSLGGFRGENCGVTICKHVLSTIDSIRVLLNPSLDLIKIPERERLNLALIYYAHAN